MQRVYRIRYTELRLEECFDLGLVRQICFDGNSFRTLGRSGFHYVGKDEMAVGRLGILEKCMGKLDEVYHKRS